MYRGLAFPNGVALIKDKTFLLVAESIPMRVLRFWLHDHRAMCPPQPFAQLQKFPDNIEADSKGEFGVALNTERGNNKRNLVAVKLDGNGTVVRNVYGNEQNALDSVNEIEEHNGYLYAGSPVQPYVVCRQGLATIVFIYLLCLVCSLFFA